MRLKELLENYLQTSYDKADSVTYISKHKLDSEIPQGIIEFIEKINGDELIKDKEFHLFSKQLSKLNEKAKECIIHLLSSISFNKYNEHKKTLKMRLLVLSSAWQKAKNCLKAQEKTTKSTLDYSIVISSLLITFLYMREAITSPILG